MELRELGEKSRMGVRGGDFILKIRTSTGSGRARVKVARRAHAGLGVGGRCPMRTGRHTAVSLLLRLAHAKLTHVIASGFAVAG